MTKVPATSSAPSTKRSTTRPKRASRSTGPDEPQSLADKAYAALEEMIVTMQIAPGSAVSEAGLSTLLGIGRTPIRVAIQRLAQEKLVMVLPQRGIIVSEINVGSQLRLLEVRRELERLVVRSAARRASEEELKRFHEIAKGLEKASRTNDETTFMRLDREFNLLSLSAARNEHLSVAMSLTHALSRRFWYIHYKQVADMPLSARLHADIARAIGNRDEAAAAKASDALIDYLEEFTRATLDMGLQR